MKKARDQRPGLNCAILPWSAAQSRVLEAEVRASDAGRERTHVRISTVTRLQAGVLAVAGEPVEEDLVLRVPYTADRGVRVACQPEPNPHHRIPPHHQSAAPKLSPGRR